MSGHTMALLRIAGNLPSTFYAVWGHVQPALADGEISEQEAQRIAKRVIRDAGGDLITVKIKGQDIVTEPAERHLAAFLAVVIRNIIEASRS